MAVDVYQKVERDFGESAEEIHQALRALDQETRGMISDRLVRAIVYLAQGDAIKFYGLVAEAQTEWDKVLYEAEHDKTTGEKVRNFDRTFHELKLMS